MLRFFPIIFLLFPTVVLSEVGFRDLKIGSPIITIEENCGLKNGVYTCYDIDDIVFSFSISNVFLASKIEKRIGYKLYLEQEPQKTKETDNQTSNKSSPRIVELEVHTAINHEFLKPGMKFSKIGEGSDGLRVGMTESEVSDNWEREKKWLKQFCHDCILYNYDVENKPNKLISEITIDLGPLYQTFLDKITGDPKNPYIKLKKSLDTNYDLDWEFTDRDRKLFNEGEKNSLWTSYNSGQVFSQILREDNSRDLRLYVHYHTKTDGELLSEERKPQNVNFSDF